MSDSFEDIFGQQSNLHFFVESNSPILPLLLSQDLPFQLHQFGTAQDVQSANLIIQREIIEENMEINRQIQSSNSSTNRESARVNNTVFKTTLGQFRKSMIDIIKKTASINFLKNQIDNIYKAKNQSVFPKLLSMVRELEISEQVKEAWELRKIKLLQKKKMLFQDGQYPQKRLQQLQKQVAVFEKTFNQVDFQKSFDTYWGKFKQYQKYQKSKKQVFDYRQTFAEKVKLMKKQQEKIAGSKRGARSRCEEEKNKKTSKQK